MKLVTSIIFFFTKSVFSQKILASLEKQCFQEILHITQQICHFLILKNHVFSYTHKKTTFFARKPYFHAYYRSNSFSVAFYGK